MFTFTAVDRKIAVVRQIIGREPMFVQKEIEDGEKAIVAALETRGGDTEAFEVFTERHERAQELLEMLFHAADFHFRWQERYRGSEVVQFALIRPMSQN